MSAGYSGTPLAKKLGIKAGHRVATLDAPDHFPELLGDLPDAVVLEADPALPPDLDHPEARSRDVVVLFVRSEADLALGLEPARRLLAWNGGLWVSWPKQSSPLATSLKEGHVRRAGLDAGLVDNKICAVDEDWSGLRLVYRREDRP